MEVYIHAFLTLALKASVVSSTPRRGPRARMEVRKAQRHEVVECARMEVYIHAFLTLELKASVVSSTPLRGPRARMDSVDTSKVRKAQRHEVVECARMEVYIHAFLTLALKASVVSSTPRRGPRARMDSVETRKMSVPAGNKVRIPCGIVTTVTELPQSVTEIGGTTVLLCIWEPQCSYLGLKTGYPNTFFVICLSPHRKLRGQYKTGQQHFQLHP